MTNYNPKKHSPTTRLMLEALEDVAWHLNPESGGGILHADALAPMEHGDETMFEWIKDVIRAAKSDGVTP